MGITRNTQLSLKAPTIRLKMQFYNISKVDYQNSHNLIWEKSLIVSVIWVSPIPRLDALVNWHRLALGGLRRIEIRLKCNNAHFKQRFFILRPRIPLSLFEKMIFSVLEERKCKRLWLVDFVNLALKYSIFLSKIMSRPANIKLQFIFVLEMNEWEWQLCHLKRRQSLAELWALCVCTPPARPRSPGSVTVSLRIAHVVYISAPTPSIHQPLCTELGHWP